MSLIDLCQWMMLEVHSLPSPFTYGFGKAGCSEIPAAGIPDSGKITQVSYSLGRSEQHLYFRLD